MITIRRIINNVEVFCSTEEVYELNGAGNLAPTGAWYGAFKFGYPPAVVVGESVKDQNGHTHLYPSSAAALNAAIAEATNRVNNP